MGVVWGVAICGTIGRAVRFGMGKNGWGVRRADWRAKRGVLEKKPIARKRLHL